MERWEYRVVSFPAGGYTAALNAYGREGWELVSVTHDAPSVTSSEGGRSIPMPRVVGRLEDAAAQLNKLSDSVDPPAATTGLLWVLRRPVYDDDD